jgi:hypothetical protein
LEVVQKSCSFLGGWRLVDALSLNYPAITCVALTSYFKFLTVIYHGLNCFFFK